jgi:ParB family chromosome partitioning protein
MSKELEKMVKPTNNSTLRPSLGLEDMVGEFFYISVEDLIPFHNQARQSFDTEEINLLADSIKIHGVRHPLTIMRAENNKYEVVSGERRLRAAKVAGLDKVPCIIISDIKKADSIALVENLHRKDLHPVELGQTYKNLLDAGIFSTQSELGNKISVTKSHISEHLKYADLDKKIQKHIIESKIFSRDKLRQIIKANSKGETNKINRILGIETTPIGNFSVLRIISAQGKMQFQDKGMNKLSSLQKEELKKYLSALINKIS